LQSIGTLGGDLSYGAGINEHGQLVGPSNVTAGGSLHAFLYTAGHLQDLGTSDGDASFATGINNRGAVAGVIQDGLNRHGFIYDGQMHAIIVDDYSFANGINDKNEVVGFSGTSLITDNGPVYAFLWKNGKAKHLPSLGGDISEANAINNAGHIVGYSRFSDDGLDHAFLYADGITKALNSASDVSSFAQAINSHDQAVGVCTGMVIWALSLVSTNLAGPSILTDSCLKTPVGYLTSLAVFQGASEAPLSEHTYGAL
jgi:probable HAF family extracellular repeat protein